MQELQALRLEQLEKFTGALVEGQTSLFKALQQNTKRLDEVSDRVDSLAVQLEANTKSLEEISRKQDEHSLTVEANTARLDKLETMLIRILEDLAVIREKLEVPRMGFAPNPESAD